MHWKNATQTLLAEWCAHARRGLVTDVDGTISPIVDQPDAAQVTPRARELLAQLQPRLTLTAVISGRAVADVRDRVGLPQLVYVGNHGLETWSDGAIHLTPQAAPYRPALEQVIAALADHQQPGVLLEDKGATLSIHYRQAVDPAAVAAALRAPVQALVAEHGLALFEGRMLFEVRPPIHVNKGTAFTQLVETHQLDAAVYIGDDTTDADALRAARDLRASGTCFALGVGVASAEGETPAIVRETADLMAYSIQDVEDFLAWVLASL